MRFKCFICTWVNADVASRALVKVLLPDEFWEMDITEIKQDHMDIIPSDLYQHCLGLGRGLSNFNGNSPDLIAKKLIVEIIPRFGLSLKR